MSGIDKAELVIAKGGGIAVAEVGTTLPDDPTEDLDPAFVNLGLVTENGVTLTATPDITEHRGWQRARPVRREFNAQELGAAFELEQWNADTVTLAWGGGAVTEPAPGIFRYDFPADSDALDERALVIDWADGDRHYRFVIPSGNVTDAVSTQLQRSALGILPITFQSLGADEGEEPVYFLSDDPTFGLAS